MVRINATNCVATKEAIPGYEIYQGPLLIFELDFFFSIWNLIFAGYTGSKNQV